MAGKLTDERAVAIAAMEAMDDVVSEAVMFVRLLDFMLSDAFADHQNGFYRVHEGAGDLISFVSGKAMDAMHACDKKLSNLDPRPPMGGAQ